LDPMLVIEYGISLFLSKVKVTGPGFQIFHHCKIGHKSLLAGGICLKFSGMVVFGRISHT